MIDHDKMMQCRIPLCEYMRHLDWAFCESCMRNTVLRFLSEMGEAPSVPYSPEDAKRAVAMVKWVNANADKLVKVEREFMGKRLKLLN